MKKHATDGSKLQYQTKIWKCECGNGDQGKILTASDGEVICQECGTVLGEVVSGEEDEDRADPVDCWDAEADTCRKILEDRVSKRGWQF